MALPYSRLLTVLMIFCFMHTRAQTVFYPVQSSDLLRSTATDMASLLSKALGQPVNTQSYSLIPAQGIILAYDSTISGNQSCRLQSNGSDRMLFSAAQDNGLCFGIYQYLDQMGFRFYLPGDIWEKIPQLTQIFKARDTVVSGKYKYNNWNISGGYNRWIMDNDNNYGWDIYYGKNGHDWAMYQRRNNMNGSYRFAGHRGDIMNASYLDSLRINPCYVAAYNSSREASAQSVPDINDPRAMEFWANTIGRQYTSFKNNIFANPVLYVNYFRNFKYTSSNVGIEVPDGAHWGNSGSSTGCTTGNYNGEPYPKPSDQQFILASFTSLKLKNAEAGKSLQCYAYSTHANTPSPGINIPSDLDVQVVPTAFQSETSPNALLNRWYKRTPRISEYHYYNIPQWTGETPMCSTAGYRLTLNEITSRASQGIVIEASPAKFATLPFLFAGNRQLQQQVNFDSSINEFINYMFPPEVGVHIKKLLEDFGNEHVFSTGNFINDNRFKIPLYLQRLKAAVTEASLLNFSLVNARLREIKAYIHYIILYYDLVSDPQTFVNKSQKASDLCLYLARINNLKLVNCFYLIQDILRKYPATHEIQSRFNTTDGSAYNNGNLAFINDAEIDANFSMDLARYSSLVTGYEFQLPTEIISKFNAGGLRSLPKINVTIGYTNGYEYPNRTEFYFYASRAGSVDINCAVRSGMPGGSVNISAEADNDPTLILTDTTLYASTGSALIHISFSRAGIYKVSLVSRLQTTTDLNIITNGNIFFRKGAFYGNKVENYRNDWSSLPRFYYIPSSAKKIFFSVNNACYTGHCLGGQELSNIFAIKNNNGEMVIPGLTSESALYSMDVATGTSGAFWEVNKMNEYNLCFANISNIEFYAERKVVEDIILPSGKVTLSVFPNPAKGMVYFRTNNSLPVDEIIITNAIGQQLLSVKNVSSIDISKLPAGVLLYKANISGQWINGKILKL